MIKYLREFYSLFSSFSSKLFKNSPVSFLSAIMLYLLAQISVVLAFFLPLKILVLISTDGVPRYLRFFLDQDNKNDFIYILAGLSLFFYLTYSVSDYSVRLLSKVTVRQTLLLNSNRLALSESDSFPNSIVLRTVKIWATLVIFTVCLCLGSLVRFDVFVIFIILFSSFGFVIDLTRRSTRSSSVIEKNIKLEKNFSFIVTVLSSIIYFACFIYIFYLFDAEDIDNVLIGILLLLVLKQLVQRLNHLVLDVYYFQQNSNHIKSIFYSSIDHRKIHFTKYKHFYFLNNPKFFENLTGAFNRNLSGEENDYCWNIVNSPTKDMLTFQAYNKESKKSADYFALLFTPKMESVFKRHLFFYKIFSRKLSLAPSLSGNGMYIGYYFILLDCSNNNNILQSIDEDDSFKKVKGLVLKELLSKNVSSRISSKLNCSTSFTDSLSNKDFDLISLGLDKRSLNGLIVEEFKANYSFLKELVKVSPFYIYNKNITPANLYCNDDSVYLLAWDNVVFSPLFYNLDPDKIHKFFDLESTLTYLRGKRNDVANIKLVDCQIILELGRLEYCYNKKMYSEVISHMERINDYVRIL